MTARSDVARMMTNGLGVMSDAEEARLLDAFAAEVLTEAANALEAQSCPCGCRRGVQFLRQLADAAVSAPGGER